MKINAFCTNPDMLRGRDRISVIFAGAFEPEPLGGKARSTSIPLYTPEDFKNGTEPLESIELPSDVLIEEIEGEIPRLYPRLRFYKRVEKVEDCEGYKNLFLPSLLFENDVINAVADRVSEGACAIIGVSSTLEEVGILDSKVKLSPVMILHKLGILGSVSVCGGVYLDNDDLDLLAQERTRLILTPISSAEQGHGFPPIVAALRRGVRVSLGTGDSNEPLEEQAKFLCRTARAMMNDPAVLDYDTAFSLFND